MLNFTAFFPHIVPLFLILAPVFILLIGPHRIKYPLTMNNLYIVLTVWVEWLTPIYEGRRAILNIKFTLNQTYPSQT